MDGATPPPETASNAAPSKAKNPVDAAWLKLYASADKMLRSYKRVMEFYSKWLSNLFPYLPLVKVYKTHRVWKAVDTLDAMADQAEMLFELGAAQSLLDAAAECRSWVIEEPTTLSTQRSFAEKILLIAEKLVVDNPKEKYPVEEAPCRKNIRGSFTKLAEETHRWMKDAVKRCDIFLRITTPIDGTDSDDGSSGDQTPKRRNRNAPFSTEPQFHYPGESSARSSVRTPHMTRAMRVRFDDSARAAFRRATPSAAGKILAEAEHRHIEDDKVPHLDLTENGNVVGNDQVDDNGQGTPRAPSPAYSTEDYPATPAPKARDLLDGALRENHGGDQEHLLNGTYPRRTQSAEKRHRRALFAELERVNFPPDSFEYEDDDDEANNEGGRRVE